MEANVTETMFRYIAQIRLDNASIADCTFNLSQMRPLISWFDLRAPLHIMAVELAYDSMQPLNGFRQKSIDYSASFKKLYAYSLVNISLTGGHLL